MKDRFSALANQYAQFRPTYPPALFDFIYKQVYHFDAAWDVGTGNGQAARELSKKFKNVFATDISEKQIENAYRAENIYYSIATERSSFADQSFDLITVAQAAHWFDMKVFSNEVNRLLKPGGKIALWGYGLLTVNTEIDLLINHFYKNVINSYWDQERRHIDEHYANLYYPFKEIQSPEFAITVLWTFEDLRGYLSTWSAVQMYISQKSQNPVDELMLKIKDHWKVEKQMVKFPLFLRLGSLQK